MTILFRNDRGNIIASIEVKDDFIVEDRSHGCFVSDIDSNNNGEIIYRVDIIPDPELIHNISNETLLNEIRDRMRE